MAFENEKEKLKDENTNNKVEVLDLESRKAMIPAIQLIIIVTRHLN